MLVSPILKESIICPTIKYISTEIQAIESHTNTQTSLKESGRGCNLNSEYFTLKGKFSNTGTNKTHTHTTQNAIGRLGRIFTSQRQREVNFTQEGLLKLLPS